MTPAEAALHEAARAELARIYGKTQRQVDVDNAEARRLTTRRQVEREQEPRRLRIVRERAS